MPHALRDYQHECVNALFNYFKTKKGNPLVGLPTGTGKSLVIANFCERALKWYPNQKILVATHVKELIEQNFAEFLDQWPTAPAGIYSAGVGRKEVHNKVTFCGVQSIAKQIAEFGKIDLFLVDECHLISPDEETQYMKVINFLKKVNPRMKVIGFTATPWRAGVGLLTEGPLFTDFAINLTDMRSFNRFIREGYLLPLVSKPTKEFLDVKGVHMRMGDYNEKQLQLAVNKDEITWSALNEAKQLADEEGRRSWIVFATGLDHAARIEEMLTMLGVSCRQVHSKMSKGERDKNIKDWKDLKYTCVINKGVLTTGINHPALDLIIMLRPTMSTVLWVQMLGRGTRPLYAPGFDIMTLQGRLAAIAASPKQTCRVLDFAGNIKRLGPINDPVLPRKKGESKGEAPVKICDCCGEYNHISARYCGGEPFKTNEGCGAEFSFKIQLKTTASTEAILKNDEPIIEAFEVDRLELAVLQKAGKAPCVRVFYHCGFNRFSEFIFPETQGWGRRKAATWWAERTALPLPLTAQECVDVSDQLLVPVAIKVWINKAPFPEVMVASFTGAFQTAITGEEIPF